MAVGDALPYILRTGSYFNEEHVAQATELVNRKLLGLDKLDTLFDVICSQTKTPREWLCTVADGLGPFSMLVSLKRQILGKGLHTAPKEESLPMTYAPKKKGHYDASQSSSGQMPDSPTARHPKRLRLGDFDAMDDRLAPSQSSTPPKIELSEQTLDEIPDEIPDPRTPTETLVVDFMVNLLGGLACLVQPLAYRTVCVANAFETTYQFGPLPNGPPSNHVQFRARIDGSIPFSLPQDKSLPEMVIFEAKRAHRETGQGVTVMGQQSMEHVAYIWKRHEKDQLVNLLFLSFSSREALMANTFCIAEVSRNQSYFHDCTRFPVLLH
jgi:hypothetical protein